MKYVPKSKSKWIKKKDYSKKIIFAPEDFPTKGHLLQVVVIPPDTKQRLHYHHQQTEVFYILEGETEIYINGKKFLAKPGDAFVCAPGDEHNLWNKTDKPFKLAVFKTDLPEGEDSVWEKEPEPTPGVD